MFTNLFVIKSILEIVFIPLSMFFIYVIFKNILKAKDNSKQKSIFNFVILVLLFIIIASNICSEILFVSNIGALYSKVIFKIQSISYAFVILACIIYIYNSLRIQKYHKILVNVVIISTLPITALIIATPIDLIYKPGYISYVISQAFFNYIHLAGVIICLTIGLLMLIGYSSNRLKYSAALQGVSIVFISSTELIFYLNKSFGNVYVDISSSIIQLIAIMVFYISMQYLESNQDLFNPFTFFTQRIFNKIILLLVVVTIISAYGVNLISTKIHQEAVMEKTVKTLDKFIGKIEIDITNDKLLQIQKYIWTMDLPQKSYVFFTDNNFVIKYHPDQTRIGQSVSVPKSRFSVQGDYKIIDDREGEKYLQYYKASEKLPYTVFIVQPLSETLRKIYESQVYTIFYVGILIMVLILIASIYAKNMMKPLSELLTGIHAIRANDLEHRIDITNKDELGEIAKAFNYMADSLQEAQEMKVDAERKLLFSQMVVSFSHEIKNPLASIIVSAQMLEEIEMDEESKELVEVVYSESSRIMKLVDGLRDMKNIKITEYGNGATMIDIRESE